METTGERLQDRLQAALGAAYTLERELGGGGMSRVFVAEDATLGRTVVVKVLRPELTEGLSAERFKREVRLAARLQHPHIVPLLVAGEFDGGVLYYAMPFVAGESLRARLARDGGLPVGDALRILRDVASALAYAQRQGVVHRDVKPENILLADGGAVVADFGIAKAISASRGGTSDGSGEAGRDGAGRRSSTLTSAGTSLGTPAYMAPEQAAGDVVDHRADLYALGVVAYELLAGRPPFDGRTAQQLLAAHVTEVPEPITRRRPNTPPALGALVMRLLEKHPGDRPQSADEVLRALDAAATMATVAPLPVVDVVVTPAGTSRAATDAVSSRSEGAVPHEPSASRGARGPRGRSRLMLIAGAAVAVAVAVAGAALGAASMRLREAPLRPLVATLAPPEGAILRPSAGFALSPDGTRLAFIAEDGRDQALWVRALGDLRATRVAGTERGAGPFWSPDGASLGFFADGRLKVVDLRGGAPRVLCPAPRSGGAAWTRDVDIVYVPNVAGGLFRVAAAGGPCTPVDNLRPGDFDFRRPSALPDGRHVLVSSISARRTLAVDLSTGAVTEVRRSSVDAQFAAPDWRLFRDDERGVLYAQKLDLRTLRPVGEARAVLDPVTREIATYGGYAASARTLVALRALTSSQTLVWVSRQSAVVDSIVAPADAIGLFGALNVSLSHDGRSVALGGRGLWLHDRARGVPARVQVDTVGAWIADPVWSPGDSLIAYVTVTGGPPALQVYHVRTGATTALVSPGQRSVRTPDWSPDGRRIVFQLDPGDAAPRGEIWVYSLTERRASRLWTSAARLSAPRWSPDGQWLAYVSNETDASEVYLRPVSGPGVALRVSAAGGDRPRWRADGRELYYRTPDGAIMAVGVRLGLAPSLSPPRLVVSGVAFARDLRGFEVTPDGERFVGAARGDPVVFTLLVDWASRLLRR